MNYEIKATPGCEDLLEGALLGACLNGLLVRAESEGDAIRQVWNRVQGLAPARRKPVGAQEDALRTGRFWCAGWRFWVEPTCAAPHDLARILAHEAR